MATGRTLHLCESFDAACVGATDAPVVGAAVFVGHDPHGYCARICQGSVFGPTSRRISDPSFDTVASMAVGTLGNATSVGAYVANHDVWLHCPDPGVRERLCQAARSSGHAVAICDDAPSGSVDPYDLFRQRKTAASDTGSKTSVSCCRVDPRSHDPLESGAVVRMMISGDRRTVNYTDVDGNVLSMHGILPHQLDDEQVSKVLSVSASVTTQVWGKQWIGGEIVPVQSVFFDIPAEIDAMLADSVIPPEYDATDGT